MTYEVPKPPTDVDVAVDELLTSIHVRLGLDEIDEARGTLRRALMYAWYDGQSAGLAGDRAGVDVRQNPWIRSVK